MDKKLFCLLFIISLILLNNLSISSGQKFYRGRLFRKCRLDSLGDLAKYTTNLFDQRLDHFDPTNNRTWKQRYLVYGNTNKVENSPVFLDLGGEGGICSFSSHLGRLDDSLNIFLEHRYYGQSHPTSDLSTENLKYLTSEQALQDAATFIEYFKKEHNLTNNKWIVSGCSYSAALAAWFRLKYPHLVVGAIAGSAPIQAEFNFDRYLEVVQTSLGPKCSGEIRLAMEEFGKLLQSKEGWEKLSKLFNLCTPLNGTNKLDVSNLVSQIVDNVSEFVQYNHDIQIFCNRIINSIQQSALERLANAFNAFNFNECLEHRYQKEIEKISDVKWQSHSGHIGGRQWTYQTCTEFGYFQTTDSPNQPFVGNYLQLDFFIQMCKDLFGNKFNKQFIEQAVAFSNNHYGGYNISGSNVVFVNGLIDPWHKLSILQDINPTVKAIVQPDVAHCSRTGETKEKIAKIIDEFLKN